MSRRATGRQAGDGREMSAATSTSAARSSLQSSKPESHSRMTRAGSAYRQRVPFCRAGRKKERQKVSVDKHPPSFPICGLQQRPASGPAGPVGVFRSSSGPFDPLRTGTRPQPGKDPQERPQAKATVDGEVGGTMAAWAWRFALDLS